MGYAIQQIIDENGDHIDWDGTLTALPDGTLGSVWLKEKPDGTVGQVIVKDILEDHIVRAKGIDVSVLAQATATVASISVPVGAVYVVKGYGLSAGATSIDTFQVEVDGVVESKIHLNTYQGGILRDYIMADNSAGSVPMVVQMTAHNDASLAALVASGFMVAEDITQEQAAI